VNSDSIVALSLGSSERAFLWKDKKSPVPSTGRSLKEVDTPLKVHTPLLVAAD
jgi:hypothetical protein